MVASELMVAVLAVHQSSSVVAMHQSKAAVWHRQLLLLDIHFPSSLLPQASCSSQPCSQQPHQCLDNSQVWGLGIEVHEVPAGMALGCCRQCCNLFLFGAGRIAYSSIHKIILCQHLRSIRTGELGTAVLVVCVDESLFELLLLLPAMESCWSVCAFVGLDQSFQSHIFPAAGGVKLRAASVVVTLHALDCFQPLLVVLHCNLLLVVTHMNQLPGCH